MNQCKITVIFVLMICSCSAIPHFLTFNLNSTQARTVLQPLINQYPSLGTELNNISNLAINTSFSTLFNYILSNSSVFDQLLPNISIIVPFTWTSILTQIQKQTLLQHLFTNQLILFYALMMDNKYPANQIQCQELLQAVISSNLQNTITAILTPITGTYFFDKRCILSLSTFLYIVDSLKVNLTYQEKLGLVPTLKRIKVVHKLIFNAQ